MDIIAGELSWKSPKNLFLFGFLRKINSYR